MRVKISKECGRNFRRKITLKNNFSSDAFAHPRLAVGTPLTSSHAAFTVFNNVNKSIQTNIRECLIVVIDNHKTKS
ncbi:hypothetical protein HanRHA438_Chr07g0307041 [Helianthus annuus]|nr:hypothetical protein HanIR_Chr07g0320321 [Helianthus annuus]KAJ0908136.1 hypothetical protein HanRHA438_Chr07g0307041 [Helianthus annuus]